MQWLEYVEAYCVICVGLSSSHILSTVTDMHEPDLQNSEGYSTQLTEGNISYPHSGLTATRQNSEITFTNFVHLWQDGPLSASTPSQHQLATSNLQAKEILDLL